ncbi:hypothetical protein FS842_010871 [Serendipita sp. 407]|nr:hypothetical protein FS842_010871 [Serendipita sp. 407]
MEWRTVRTGKTGKTAASLSASVTKVWTAEARFGTLVSSIPPVHNGKKGRVKTKLVVFLVFVIKKRKRKKKDSSRQRHDEDEDEASAIKEQEQEQLRNSRGSPFAKDRAATAPSRAEADLDTGAVALRWNDGRADMVVDESRRFKDAGGVLDLSSSSSS